MTDIAVREPRPVSLSTEQLQYIAGTEFVPPGLRGNMPAILACVATGRELGIGDMVALKSIHIIDGKATFSAELMVQLVRRAGHSITGEVSEGSATVTGKRADNGDTMTATWTLAMAERAGLLNKSNWKKYPEAMLWARAVSQLCRMLFADCFAGNTYTTEELGEEQTGTDGVPVPEDDGLFPPAGMEASVGEPQAAGPSTEPASPAAESRPTKRQIDKLNVMVGKLRPDHVSTLQLWQGMGREPEPDADGTLHWSPLRDSLTKAEAHALIDRLTALEERVAGEAGSQFQIPEGAR